MNRLTLENNNNGTVGHAYNDAGLRTNMTVTGENAVCYWYDVADGLANVTHGAFVTVAFFDY